jgi:hypothetical protein
MFLKIFFSDSDDSMRKRQIVHPKQSHSESPTSSKESDNSNDTSNAAKTTWIKEDKTPNLGSFNGNPGVKRIPSDPTKVPEITELFFRRQLL